MLRKNHNLVNRAQMGPGTERRGDNVDFRQDRKRRRIRRKTPSPSNTDACMVSFLWTKRYNRWQNVKAWGTSPVW